MIIVLDKDQLPTMNMLQGGLLNDKDFIDDFMQFTTNLLAVALDEPGVPNIKEVDKHSTGVLIMLCFNWRPE